MQTWKQVHLFLWTNYSSLLNVGILRMSAAHCHSKTRYISFSVHTSNSSWQQLIFLAVAFFLNPQHQCNSLHWCSECSDALEMSQCVHPPPRGEVLLSWLHLLLGCCDGRESSRPICEIIWVLFVSCVGLGSGLWFSSVWKVPCHSWFG